MRERAPHLASGSAAPRCARRQRFRIQPRVTLRLASPWAPKRHVRMGARAKRCVVIIRVERRRERDDSWEGCLCPMPLARCGGCRLRERDPFVRPLGDGVHRGRQCASLPGERVLHADRRLWNDRPLDDPFLLELLKAFTQHPVRDLGNGGPQHGEAAPGLEEHEDDRAGPSPADQLAGAVKPRAQFRGVSGRILRHVTRIAQSL